MYAIDVEGYPLRRIFFLFGKIWRITSRPSLPLIRRAMQVPKKKYVTHASTYSPPRPPGYPPRCMIGCPMVGWYKRDESPGIAGVLSRGGGGIGANDRSE